MEHFNLASERIRIGLNQKQLGEILGYDVKTIGKWEKNISTMPSETAIKAANLFDCSVDYLMGETDDRRSAKSRELAATR